MKKKLILTKNVKYDYESVVIINNDDDMSYCESDDDLVMLTEAVEVDFIELDNKTVINSQVVIIERQITKVKADAEAALTALDGKKQELLALPESIN